MILTCPACSSRYLIEPASLGASGRTVRCAACGHRWFAEPPNDAPRHAVAEPSSPGDGEVAAVAAPAARADEATGRSSRRLIGWLALALVVLVIAGAVVGRNEIVAQVPEAASIYRKLGLSVTVPFGLEFRDVTSTRLDEGGVAVLVVEGEIVNITGGSRTVPSVRVALLDEAKRELEHEIVAAAERAVDGGETTRFVARMVNPPEQARNFSVTFAADG